MEKLVHSAKSSQQQQQQMTKSVRCNRNESVDENRHTREQYNEKNESFDWTEADF